jgi:hypothetical protein
VHSLAASISLLLVVVVVIVVIAVEHGVEEITLVV